MKYSHDCFGSSLHITISSWEDISQLVQECFKMVDLFEQKYSRFIDGNFLSELNKNKSSQIDAEFLSILKLCLKVSKLTKGYFDITLLPVLENLGYGIAVNIQNESLWYENIIIKDNTINLKNEVSLDIWAIGKWYMVDKIYNVLKHKVEAFTINFGWDIRVKWTQKIELEDPANRDKTIGNMEISNASIASSAGNKRVFWSSHHLINAKTKESQNDKIALYVTHKLSSFSDIFSTALFVTPLELSLKILEQTPWLEALIIASDGVMYKSRWFNCNLNMK